MQEITLPMSGAQPLPGMGSGVRLPGEIRVRVKGESYGEIRKFVNENPDVAVLTVRFSGGDVWLSQALPLLPASFNEVRCLFCRDMFA